MFKDIFALLHNNPATSFHFPRALAFQNILLVWQRQKQRQPKTKQNSKCGEKSKSKARKNKTCLPLQFDCYIFVRVDGYANFPWLVLWDQRLCFFGRLTAPHWPCSAAMIYILTACAYLSNSN